MASLLCACWASLFPAVFFRRSESNTVMNITSSMHTRAIFNVAKMLDPCRGLTARPLAQRIENVTYILYSIGTRELGMSGRNRVQTRKKTRGRLLNNILLPHVPRPSRTLSHHIIHTGGRERKVVARGWAIQRSIDDEVSVLLLYSTGFQANFIQSSGMSISRTSLRNDFPPIPTAEGVRAISYELSVDLKQQSRAREMELTPRGQNQTSPNELDTNWQYRRRGSKNCCFGQFLIPAKHWPARDKGLPVPGVERQWCTRPVAFSGKEKARIELGSPKDRRSRLRDEAIANQLPRLMGIKDAVGERTVPSGRGTKTVLDRMVSQVPGRSPTAVAGLPLNGVRRGFSCGIMMSRSLEGGEAIEGTKNGTRTEGTVDGAALPPMMVTSLRSRIEATERRASDECKPRMRGECTGISSGMQMVVKSKEQMWLTAKLAQILNVSSPSIFGPFWIPFHLVYPPNHSLVGGNIPTLRFKLSKQINKSRARESSENPIQNIKRKFDASAFTEIYDHSLRALRARPRRAPAT
ncbi:hypothetical protein DFH09DRAFT_1089343 [Mycena vulgaris]|nr:hypothetical protein DFH09DRAFT_1089343 [Mycena vulgaris]